MRIVPVYDVSKEKAFLFMLKKYMLKNVLLQCIIMELLD